MEQRRLRLGDILDDYCPRERRVTNHAVVAMIEENVKQTRCTTCDAEHAYKGGREPRRRKTSETSALYREVLADMPEARRAPAVATTAVATPDSDAVPVSAVSKAETMEEPVGLPKEDDVATEDAVEEPREEGPVHRPLIRATLPRPEGQKEVRQIPDFTIRHHTGRGGQFRGDRSQRAGGANGNGNGNRPHGRRFPGGHQAALPGRGSSGRGGGGFRGGQGQGQGQGQGPQRHGGKKRSR